MQLEVGMIVEGKVTGITKFGAFVTLAEGKSGLVHISEVANTFVNDIREFVKEGDAVKVRVIGLGQDGKINLSIKKAEEQAPEPRQPKPEFRAKQFNQWQPAQRESAPTNNVSFEDKLKMFMQESDSKMASNKLYSDRRPSNRKRK